MNSRELHRVLHGSLPESILARRIQSAIVRHVRGLLALPAQELLDRRLEKFLKMGVYLEETGPIPAPVGEG